MQDAPATSTPPSTSSGEATVLVVDDDDLLRRTTVKILQRAKFRPLQADTGEAALETISSSQVDVVLLDVMLPGINGLETLDRIKRAYPDVEVVMMTGHADLSLAVDAVRRGAHDFLAKPFASNDLVVLAVEKATEHANLVATARASQSSAMPPLVGESRAMKQVYKLAKDVAATSVSVLLLGETGTGKEVLARAIHDASLRANEPFVPTNCSAIPQELIESELFGHEKGAFTGATRTRPGLFQQAHKGTLFLDEVGDLPLLGQAKLLRALQSGEVRRVGADETRSLDVRIISATNADLPKKIKQKQFREDLFYRLNSGHHPHPKPRSTQGRRGSAGSPLRTQTCTTSGNQPQALQPGVPVWQLTEYHLASETCRQLENVVERSLVVTRGAVIRSADLDFTTAATGVPAPHRAAQGGFEAQFEQLFDLPFTEAKRRLTQQFEARYVTRLLQQVDGNISEAARRSGLDRTNFRRILRRSAKT